MFQPTHLVRCLALLLPLSLAAVPPLTQAAQKHTQHATTKSSAQDVATAPDIDEERRIQAAVLECVREAHRVERLAVVATIDEVRRT